MSFTLTELPWARNALEPVISAETVDYHHGKHHRAYVDKLNTLTANSPLAGKTLRELVLSSDGALFNNAAQTWNHDFYWQGLSPAESEPSELLARRLDQHFGSLDGFRKAFIDCAGTNFASGWTWLVLRPEGALDIVNTDDADNPLRQGLAPLLTVDVWEHAYYIDYRNDRGKYLAALFTVVNWDFVSRKLAEAEAQADD